jgi:bifunctional DNase/RNase
VTRVVINDLQDATFFATIDIDTPKGTRHIDSRPSDALAVAVRAKCPVFVDGGAIGALIDAEEVNGLPDSPSEENGEDDEAARFRRLLGDD